MLAARYFSCSCLTTKIASVVPLPGTFLETRIQQLLDGLIFVEKGLHVHVQGMLKLSRVYTLAEILSKIFVKIEDLIYDHGFTN